MVAPEAAVDGAARAVARVDQEMHPLVVEREREVCGDGREGQRPGGEQRSVDPEQDWEREQERVPGNEEQLGLPGIEVMGSVQARRARVEARDPAPGLGVEDEDVDQPLLERPKHCDRRHHDEIPPAEGAQEGAHQQCGGEGRGQDARASVRGEEPEHAADLVGQSGRLGCSD